MKTKPSITCLLNLGNTSTPAYTFIKDRFEWQEGYGAFSYSISQVSTVIAYIQNQEAHHRAITFLEEYKKFPERFEVDYDERFIFKAPE